MLNDLLVSMLKQHSEKTNHQIEQLISSFIEKHGISMDTFMLNYSIVEDIDFVNPEMNHEDNQMRFGIRSSMRVMRKN